MLFFFLNDTSTTEIYTLSLHDVLPILHGIAGTGKSTLLEAFTQRARAAGATVIRLDCRTIEATEAGFLSELIAARSEEHTSELQSRQYLVCRLLLEKKKKKQDYLHKEV